MAPDAEQRLDDLREAFTDPHVDIVFAACGGTQAEELAEGIRDFQFPIVKPFVGYSDTISINLALWESQRLVSYSGSSFMTHFGEPPFIWPEALREFRSVHESWSRRVLKPALNYALVKREWVNPKIESGVQARDTHFPGHQWLQLGRTDGWLFATDLQSLVELAAGGSLDLTGSVLFVDVSVIDPEQLNTELKKLADEGVYDRIRGLGLSWNPKVLPRDWFGLIHNALRGMLAPEIPTVVGIDVCHYQPCWVVPIGSPVQLDSDTGVTLRRSTTGSSVPT